MASRATSLATAKTSPAGAATDDPAVLAEVARILSALEYGQVQITVHDGRVVEICTTVRKRLKA